MSDIKTVLPLVEDGENQALRMFLSLYGGTNSVTTKRMRGHLASAGYEGCWPEWANEDQHLTKGGAQHWIRHLISLEAAVLSANKNEAHLYAVRNGALQAAIEILIDLNDQSEVGDAFDMAIDSLREMKLWSIPSTAQQAIDAGKV